MKQPNEFPYVLHNQKLGVFEYGTAKIIFGETVKNKLGVAFSMEAAQQRLVEYGIDFSVYDAVIKATPKQDAK